MQQRGVGCTLFVAKQDSGVCLKHIAMVQEEGGDNGGWTGELGGM